MTLNRNICANGANNKNNKKIKKGVRCSRPQGSAFLI